MAAIDYATTLGLLDAALATATGADLALGTDIRTRIADLGAELTARFTPSVDTAKTAWAAAASAAFDEAEEAAGYVYSVVGEPAPPNLTFNTYDQTEILERLRAASSLAQSAQLIPNLAQSARFLQRVVEQHRSTWNAAFNVGPLGAADYTTARARLPYSRTVTSAASLERQIYALFPEATSWLALAAL